MTFTAFVAWFFAAIQPPSDPAAYSRWLAHLSRVDQDSIATYCKAHPSSYSDACGGIGPLHIPHRPPGSSPAVAPDPRAEVRWRASLTPPQAAYVDRMCDTEDPDLLASELCGGVNTPLVVSFDDAPVEFRAGARFAFRPGTPVATDWPTDATPWIALDRDGDGRITSGAELFGNATPGGYANGFEALRALDANGDGVIDARDPAFASLVLWNDAGIVPLSSRIVSISLADRLVRRCDSRGDCEGERAPIVWRDATGALRGGTVVDVYLADQ